MTRVRPASEPPVPHGGDVSAAAAAYGMPEDGWLDLSTGINPQPYPVPEPSRRAWTALPQAADADALRAAAAAAYGAPDPSLVVPAPGTQALIQILPRVLPASRAVVVAPTYGEYGPAWRAAGHDVTAAETPEAGLAELDGAGGRPTLIVCNPNNPDGRRWPPQTLLPIADALAACGGCLVVDEAFADVAPEVSLAPEAGRPGLVVLRSFGKFFGLAGLRLGFALAPPDLGAALARNLGPWAVSGPALELGRHALADADWIAATRRRLRSGAARLDALFAALGLEVVGGTELFRLVSCGHAAGVQQGLARRGILVRAFDYNSAWLRFGLPGTVADWRRLEAALPRALEEAASER